MSLSRTSALPRPDLASGLPRTFRALVVLALVLLSMPVVSTTAQAAPVFSVRPISWNVVGLDSNNLSTGPDTFASGVEVCNVGTTAALDVVATYVWDSVNTYVNLAGPPTLSEPVLPPGGCTDFYFNVAVTRNAAAYDTVRRFHIDVTATGLGTSSTPTPREIYVEKLISQNRNSIDSITGPASVFVGGTYTYVLNSSTAPGGYEQLASFLNFPNTIFQVLSVSSTYTTGGSNDTIYADACGWENDPTSPTYRSCVGPTHPVYGPKAGGTVATTYSVKILAVPGGGATGSVSLTGLVYDFSGASYHYNSDYGSDSITVSVSKSADVSITKSDSPDPVVAGNDLTYSMTVANAGPSTAEGVMVSDPLPADTSFVSATGGGTYDAGTNTVSWSLGDLASGGSMSLQLVVAVDPALTAPLSNTATVSTTVPDPSAANDSATQGTTVTTSADLSLSKADAPDPVGVGEPLTYTLTASNAGPSTAQDVVVTDTLPADVTFGSATPSQGSCSQAAGVVTCDLGTVSPGASPTVTIVVIPTAPAGVAGSVTNSASVSSSTPDPTPGNDTATEGTTVQPRADVRIDKSDSADPVIAGNTVTYSITVTNDGPSDAANVQVTDPLPDGTSFVSADAGGTEAGGTVTWNLGTLAAGASTTVELVVAVDPGRTTDLSNTATVTTTTTDPAGGNNDVTQGTGVTTSADLSITKSDAPDPVAVGQPLTYTLSVANAGSSDAVDVVVTDTLPTHVTFGSATPSQGSCSQALGVVMCDLGDLGASDSATVTIVVTPTPAAGVAGTVSNTASVSSSTSDPASGNDTATQDTAVQPRADLSIVKSDSPSTVTAGEDLTYTITVANAGPSSAQDVQVADPLPPGTSFVSAIPTVGSCSVAAGTLTCDLGALASGVSETISLVVHVDPARTADLSNTASVSSSTTDPVPGNGSATETTTVTTSADLSIAKSDSPDPVAVGQPLTYTLTVGNAGPSDAVDVVVTDTLPVDVTFDSTTPSQGSCSEAGGTATCDLGTVAAGGSATVTIVVTPTAAAGAAGSVTNSASVTSSTSDPVNGNDTDDAITAVTPIADLGVTIDDGAGAVVAGTSTTYTINLSNAGPSDVPAGVEVQVPVPLGTTGVESESDCSIALDVLTCTTSAPVAAGSSASWQLVLAVSPAYALADLGVTATIAASPYADPDPSNDAHTDTDAVSSEADVAVTVADGELTVTAGDGSAHTYTILVTNDGPSTATGLVVTGSWPVALTRGTLPPGCSDVGAGPGFTCTVPNIAPGASASIQVDYTVPADTPGGVVTMAAAMAAANDSSVGNDDDTDDTTVLTSADLSIAKADSADPVTDGDTFSYTLSVVNAGLSDATTVTVVDTLPVEVGFVSATPSQGSCVEASGTVTCSLGVLPASSAVSITIGVTAEAAGAISNTATVSSSTADPDPSDDSAAEDTTIDPLADLGVTMSDAPDPVAAGDDVTYTATVTNDGPSDALDVGLTNMIPAGTTFVSATPSQGSCSEAAGIVTCDLGDLPDGGIVTVEVVVTTSVNGVLTEQASVGATTPDPNPANDSALEDTDVTPVADLGVTIDDGTGSITAGSFTTYSITLSNAGPSEVPAGVEIQVPIPSDTVGSESEPNCALVLGVMTCTTSAPVPAGGGVTWQLTLDVSSGYTLPDLSVSATIASSPYADPNPSNDTATDVDAVNVEADLWVEIDDGVPSVVAGTSTMYTVELWNAGPSTEPAGAVVTVTLPAGTTGSTTHPDCSVVGLVMTCTTSSTLAPGGSASWALDLVIGSGYAGASVDVLAQVLSTPIPDPNAVNDTASDSDALTASVDLAVTIADSPDPVLLTQTLTYTLGAVNLGPSDATGVTVTSSLPAGAMFISATPSQGTCSEAGGVVTCALGDLADGASASVSVIVTPTVVGTATSSVTVTADQADADPANDADAEDTVVADPADVWVTIADTPDPAPPGADVTYTLSVGNAGPDPATGVTVTNTLPAGVTFISTTPSQGTCSEAGGVVTCALGGLADGASATMAIVVTPGGPGTLTNTVSVSADQADPVLANNADVAVTSVTAPGSADLSIAKGDAPDPVLVGQNVTYTLTVTDAGPDTATAVAVSDALPVGLTLVSATPSVGTCTVVGAVVTCDLGDLATSATATVSIVATATVAGTVTNTASVQSAVDDPNLANNAATQDTTVSPSADVSIAKAATPSTVEIGTDVTYTLTVANAGPSEATDVVVTDPLPPGVTFVSATPSQGACAEAAGTVTCALGTLVVGASATVTLLVTPTVTGAISNSAQVAAAEQDPDPADNASSAAVTVDPVAASVADLAVDKVADVADPEPGDTVRYTISVSNAGPADATGVVVTDALPAGLEYRSYQATQGTYLHSKGTWTVGDLDVGQAATLQIETVVTGEAGSSIDNLAQVSELDQNDPDGANDSAVAAVEVAAQEVEDEGDEQPSAVTALTGGIFGPLVRLMLLFLVLGMLALVASRRLLAERVGCPRRVPGP